MKAQIETLNDASAMQILNTIAQSRIRTSEYETAVTPEIVRYLEAEFDAAPASSEAANPGEPAREALLLLAETPEYQAPLSAMLNVHAPKASARTPSPLPPL